MEAALNIDRRKHQRHGRMGLSVRVCGHEYEVGNWSMGGFLLENYDGTLSTGALVTVEGLGCSATQMHDVELPARVVRVDEHTVAINYLGLDATAYEFLADALNQCGQMRPLTKV